MLLWREPEEAIVKLANLPDNLENVNFLLAKMILSRVFQVSITVLSKDSYCTGWKLPVKPTL